MRYLFAMGLATHLGTKRAVCGTAAPPERRTDVPGDVNCIRCRKIMRARRLKKEDPQ